MTNLLHFMWISYSAAVAFLGINVLFVGDLLPEFICRVYNFGKTSKHFLKKQSFVQYFEIPKRWFAHFYVFAVVYFLFIEVEICRRYFGTSPSLLGNTILDTFTDSNRKSSIPAESVLVLSILLLLHLSRRCYECYYVSVYSDGKINVVHYFMGLTFYFAVGLSLLFEAEGFETIPRLPETLDFPTYFSSKTHLAGIGVFVSAFFMQHQVNLHLASLRKDKKGKKVVTMDHVMPRGGWFELVSCPHFLAEIILYSSLNLLMDGRNYTWWLLCLFVATNQIMIGLSNHRWYQKTFKDYPSSRKAVIPFIL